MKSSFAFALMVAMAHASNHFSAASSCCPKACPSQQSNVCCQKCPDECTSTPDQNGPVVIQSVDDECKRLMFAWSVTQSCEPLKSTELQCLGSNGNWHPLPQLAPTATELVIDNDYFTGAPFNLNPGNNIYCQARSSNSNGYSYWSVSNDIFELPNCNPTPTVVPEGVCRPSCKATGCGGACAKQQGALSKKACQFTGACQPGPDPVMVADTVEHTHKYCHVDQTPRFIKKTKWVNKTVLSKVTEMEQVPTKHIDTVLEQRKVNVPDVVFKQQSIPTIRKVTKTVNKQISKPVTKTRTVQEAVTEYDEVPYDTFETVYVPQVRRVKKTRMVPATRMIDTLSYEDLIRTEPGYKAEMVNSYKTWKVERQLALESCSCFQPSCGCVGDRGCDCCFPACDCAPKSAEAYDLFQTESNHYVVTPFSKRSPERHPKVVQVPETQMVPEIYFEEETVQVPQLRTVTKMRQVPRVTYVPKTEKYTDYETATVPSKEDVDETFTTNVVGPEAVMTTVSVEEPREIERVFMETRAVTKTVNKTIKVPVMTVVRLPAPPCHWHTMTHRHGTTEGVTHTHSEDHDHCQDEDTDGGCKAVRTEP